MLGDGGSKPSVPRRRGVKHLHINAPELDLLCEQAAPLAARHSGWITLSPLVPSREQPPPQGPLAILISGERHDAPICSWVPGRQSRRQTKCDALGIQHSTGTGAVNRLAQAGIGVPTGWRVRQDHPRRGLVVEPPTGTPLLDMFGWLTRAGASLCRSSYDGRWEVTIHLPR
jgi:hypothetical protein